jgi:TonB family protein
MGGIALAILCLAFPIASRIGIFSALNSRPQHAPAALRDMRPGEDALVPVIGEDYVINWPADYAKALNLAVANEMLRSPQRAVLHGKVGLRIRMRRDGTVIDSVVDASSGQAVIDAEALAVIRRIGRFAPVPAKYSPGESIFNFHQPVDFGSS